MLLPRRCPLCETPGPAPCVPCRAGLRHAGTMAPVAGLDSFRAAFAYEGAVRSLLLALKYSNRRDAVAWLGGELAARAPAGAVDVITWAPTSRQRSGRRGYDQAELLAAATARALRLPARPLLRRAGGRAQTGLGAAARQVAPRFTARRVAPCSVLLVDDVATTGATLAAAAAALRTAGATSVHAVVVARTPRTAPHATWQAGGQTHANRTDPWGGPACRSPSAAARR
jgi:predicted amidophosphoribosyltransferase